MLAHCVHQIREDSQLISNPDGSTTITSPDDVTTTIPACDTQNGTVSMLLPRIPKTAQGLPPNYDGWLQYTALNTSAIGVEGGFDGFTNIMSVPDVPKEPADVLYLFPVTIRMSTEYIRHQGKPFECRLLPRSAIRASHRSATLSVPSRSRALSAHRPPGPMCLTETLFQACRLWSRVL